MASDLSPLSSTVSAVFEAFIERLEEEGAVEPGARKALKQSLMKQKLDHSSLREAMFTPNELEK
jgi:hypothetical protein